MKNIGFIFFWVITKSFWLIPFPVLYFFSDILFVFFYKITGYRKKVVYDNLRKSFPDKTEAEIEKIMRAFYKHLSDITLEGLKAFAIRKKEMLRRFKITDYEVVKKYYEQDKSIIATASHYANWEWGGIGAQVIPHKLFSLYKELKNPLIDKYAKKSRSNWGANMVSIRKTYRMFDREYEKPAIFFMLADQSPSNAYKAYWLRFLGRETAFLHGPEKYAKLFNLPVVYAEVNRVKRGFYEIIFHDITDKPQNLPEGDLTRRYKEILENQIKKDPTQWLWSHKRWKKKRPEQAKNV